jgi:hypothetical protein
VRHNPVTPGEITREKLDVLRKADAILIYGVIYGFTVTLASFPYCKAFSHGGRSEPSLDEYWGIKHVSPQSTAIP